MKAHRSPDKRNQSTKNPSSTEQEEAAATIEPPPPPPPPSSSSSFNLIFSVGLRAMAKKQKKLKNAFSFFASFLSHFHWIFRLFRTVSSFIYPPTRPQVVELLLQWIAKESLKSGIPQESSKHRRPAPPRPPPPFKFPRIPGRIHRHPLQSG